MFAFAQDGHLEDLIIPNLLSLPSQVLHVHSPARNNLHPNLLPLGSSLRREKISKEFEQLSMLASNLIFSLFARD